MICKTCGKEQERLVRKYFCSDHCYYEDTKVDITCQCGKVFRCRPNSRTVLCPDCNFTKKTCLFCKKEFNARSRNSKYCSLDCYYFYSASHRSLYRANYRRKHPYIKKIFVELLCEICGTAFMPVNSTQSCCSQRCRNKKLYRNRSVRPKNNTPRGKKWLIDKVACEHCGYDIKAALHVHHLSKERMDVVVLCANCHYIFHTLVGNKFEITTKEKCLNVLSQYLNALKAIKLV